MKKLVRWKNDKIQSVAQYMGRNVKSNGYDLTMKEI